MTRTRTAGSASHTTDVPFVEKLEYQVLRIDKDEMTVEATTDAGDTATIKVEGTADPEFPQPLFGSTSQNSDQLWVRHHPPPSAVSLRACPPPSLPTPPPPHTRLNCRPRGRPPCEQDKIKMLDESGTKFNVIVVSAMAETHVIVRLAPADHTRSRCGAEVTR